MVKAASRLAALLAGHAVALLALLACVSWATPAVTKPDYSRQRQGNKPPAVAHDVAAIWAWQPRTATVEAAARAEQAASFAPRYAAVLELRSGRHALESTFPV